MKIIPATQPNQLSPLIWKEIPQYSFFTTAVGSEGDTNVRFKLDAAHYLYFTSDGSPICQPARAISDSTFWLLKVETEAEFSVILRYKL